MRELLLVVVVWFLAVVVANTIGICDRPVIVTPKGWEEYHVPK